MYFSDRISLRTVTITSDTYGGETRSYTDTTVWANKKSVTRSEFYLANSNGIKVDIVFEVHTEDYNDQQYVLYGSTHYNVIRAYQKGEGTIELMCSIAEVDS